MNSNFTITVCGHTFIAATNPPTYVNYDMESYYSVDYYLEISKGYLIGLQSKPRTSYTQFYIHKAINRRNYRKFEKHFHGKVFLYYRDEHGNLINEEDLCHTINQEIIRLKELAKK